MWQKEDFINKCAVVFFNTIFVAFTVYGLYLSFCDAYSYKGDNGKILVISLVAGFLMCILCINSNIWCNAGLFAINLATAVTIIKNYKLVEEELGIVYGYIKRQYYIYNNLGKTRADTSRSHITFAGIQIEEKLSVIIIIILLVMLIAIATFRMKWNFLVLLPVAGLTGMEMCHGKAPLLIPACFLIAGTSGLLFGIKLEMCGGRRYFWQRRTVPGQMWTRYSIFMALIIICIIPAIITGRYTKKKIFTYSKKTLEKEHELERKAKAFAETIKGKAVKESKGYLDNKPPDQTGQAIMRIETDKMPLGNVYIRSFYADKYEGGRWSNSDAASLPDEEYAEYMAANNIRMFPNDIRKYISNIKMDVYSETKTDGVYTTYMSYNSTKYSSGNYTFFCYNVPYNINKNLMSLTEAETEFLGIKNNERYNEYVNKVYLSVPEGLKELENFASRILSNDNTSLQCMSVKNAICRDTVYSQNLKDLPSGKDYIEYFLFEQKKGYCEHYATAGTILLRYKGIPARYVSGYSISPSEFRIEHDSSGSQKCVAYVRDYNAHAWTEVYKKDLGWFPFDMTNTNGEADNNRDNATYSADKTAPAPSPQKENNNNVIGQEEAGSKNNKKDKIKDKVNNKTKDKKNAGTTKLPESKGQDNIYRTRIIAGIIIFCIFIAGIILYYRIRFMLLYKKAGKESTCSGRVLIYFDMFNRYLAICGLKGMSDLTDTEYAERLHGIFGGKSFSPQIDSACNILQRAAFSDRDIGNECEEEAELFIKNASHKAYAGCKKARHIIIYLLYKGIKFS